MMVPSYMIIVNFIPSLKIGDYLKEIARYCAEDVLTLARIYSRFLEAKGEKPLVLPLSYEECEIEIKRESK